MRIVHDEGDPRAEGLNDVVKILSTISFAPSCVDMGWTWEVERILVDDFDDMKMEPIHEPAGYRIRTTFRRPDRVTGKVETGYGRWWTVPLTETESGIVKTAYAAARTILEHELMESFKWRGTRVFDPHHTIAELGAIQPARYVKSIP